MGERFIYGEPRPEVFNHIVERCIQFKPLSVSENGVYQEQGVAYGSVSVNVNVPPPGSSLSAFADEYSDISAYAVGAFCIHDSLIFQCVSAISAPGEGQTHPWDNAEWSQRNLQSLFSGANTSFSGTVMPIEAGGTTSIKSYIDTTVGTIEAALSEV